MNDDSFFGPFPVLNTSRLVLKQILEEDAEHLFQILSNPAVLQFCDLPLHQNIPDSKKFICEIDEGYKSKNQICWGIFQLSNNQLIGLCRFYNFNARHQFVSIGFELATEYWGGGLMKEALTCAITYLFTGCHVNRIEAQVFTGNEKSVKLLEKIGFKKEGIMRQNFLIDGKLQDSLLYSILQEDIIRRY